MLRHKMEINVYVLKIMFFRKISVYALKGIKYIMSNVMNALEKNVFAIKIMFVVAVKIVIRLFKVNALAQKDLQLILQGNVHVLNQDLIKKKINVIYVVTKTVISALVTIIVLNVQMDMIIMMVNANVTSLKLFFKIYAHVKRVINSIMINVYSVKFSIANIVKSKMYVHNAHKFLYMKTNSVCVLANTAFIN